MVRHQGSGPLTVAIVDDYEIVVAGVAAALAPFAERVLVVEIDARLMPLSDVDLILYDTFAQVQGDGVDLVDLVDGTEARVVVFSWNVEPGLVDRAIRNGAAGYLSKELTAADIVEALERVGRGDVVRPDPRQPPAPERGDWPGRTAGLTAREAEVMALICQGLSNQEIAETTYLSINSVKTYIRTAYRKAGVTRRAQAVIWGLEHGFEPDRTRRVAPSAP